MKIVQRIIAFTGLLFLLNLWYKHTAFIPYLEAEAEQYLQVQKIAGCDVIYLSESSNFSPDNSNDTNRRKLSQFVSDYYPTLQFEAINKPASHAGTYRLLLDLFPETADIQTVIVSVNLRSFGANWINSTLETALNKANVFYNHRPPLVNRFLVSLNAYDHTANKERNEIMLKHWATDPLPFPAPHHTVTDWCAEHKWGDWQHPKRQLADQFIKQYAFVIKDDNPRVKDLDAIVHIARERHWKLIFSILAEDMDRADSLVGPELTGLMRQNVDWLIERYQAQEVPVINNLDLLSTQHFTDRDFPTEHYNEAGRKAIARNIALELNSIYPNDFSRPDWETADIQLLQ